MKTKQNIFIILITILLGSLASWYFFHVSQTYDGLFRSITSAFFTLPLVSLLSLIKILKNPEESSPPQETWQKIISYALFFLALFLSLFYLIQCHFYSLPSLLIFILLLLSGAFSLLEKTRKKPMKKNLLLYWAFSMLGVYFILCTTIFCYLKILEPTPLSFATEQVTQQYGEDSCYVGWIRGSKEENPLGLYWFSPQNSNEIGWVEIDVLTGALAPVA